jgi:hypothetical protein
MNLQKATVMHPLLRKITRICIASTIITTALQPIGIGSVTPSAYAEIIRTRLGEYETNANYIRRLFAQLCMVWHTRHERGT